MWKNIVDPDRPQTISRMHNECWLTKAADKHTHTHTQNIYIFLIAFHGNNGYTKTRFGTTPNLPASIAEETTVVAMHNVVLHLIKDTDKTRIKIIQSN